MEVTQEKHYKMANKIFNVIRKYSPNAQFFDTFEGQEQAVIVTHWFDLADELHNKKKSEALNSALEKFEIQRAFEDEVQACDHCGTAVNVQPTSWMWQPEYVRTDCMELICRDCMEQGDNDLLENTIKPYIGVVSVLPSWMKNQLGRLGFVCLENENVACARFESGFHPGQDDDPHTKVKQLKTHLPFHEFVFVLNSTEQFCVNWSIYVRQNKA